MMVVSDLHVLRSAGLAKNDILRISVFNMVLHRELGCD
jgi:hypothetical protein